MWGALLPGKDSDQGGFWNLVAGAGLGAIAGAMKKKPMAYKPVDQMTTPDYRKDFSGDVLGYLRGMADGSKPLMSQAEITRQLSGSRGRLFADQDAARMRIGERALGRQGRMGGMAEASMAALDREGLGQSRQLEAGLQNTLASAAPAARAQAANTGLNFMRGDQNEYLDEMHQKFQQDMARQQFSKWGNILGGAVSGMSAASGMGGMGGGMSGMFGGSGGGGAPPQTSGIDYSNFMGPPNRYGYGG